MSPSKRVSLFTLLCLLGLCGISPVFPPRTARADLLTVTGGPTAPADKALQSATLKVDFSQPFVEVNGQGTFVRHPQVWNLAWDSVHNAWKPAGAANGTRAKLPGGTRGRVAPPLSRFTVNLKYKDGTDDTWSWDQQIVGGNGQWNYGKPSPSVKIIAPVAGLPTGADNVFNVKDKAYGASGDGNRDDRAGIAEAAADAVKEGGMIYFPSGTYRIGADLNFAENVALLFDVGAKLSADKGATVTLPALTAGPYTIFTGEGVFRFSSDAPRPTILPLWWGGKADGKTDCYHAVQKMVTAVNTLGGKCQVLFPPGAYKIDRYRVDTAAGHGRGNGITDFTYINLKDFRITGYGAKLDIKGDFHRPFDRETGDNSYTNTVSAFRLDNCERFTLEGFEVNGNSQLTTRATYQRGGTTIPVWPGFSYAVATGGCKNYTLRDLNLHHYPTDLLKTGFLESVSDQHVRVIKCRFANGGRCAASINQARDVTYEDCIFTGGGDPGGKYGGTAPQVAYDIEPNYSATKDGIVTGEIDFLRCTFSDSVLGAVSGGPAVSVDSATFRDCKITNERHAENVFHLATKNTLVENSLIDCGTVNGNFYATYNSIEAVQKLTLRNSTVKSVEFGIYTPGVYGSALIEGNTLYIDAIRTPLSEGITAESSSLTLAAGNAFLAGPGYVWIGQELIRYGKKTGNVLSELSRGNAETKAAPHAAGAPVYNSYNAGTPYLNNPNTRFRNNKVYRYYRTFYPEGTVQSGGDTYHFDLTALFVGTEASGNRYGVLDGSTPPKLTTIPGAKNVFASNYSGGTKALNDLYLSTSWVPEYLKPVYDVKIPFVRGTSGAGTAQ